MSVLIFANGDIETGDWIRPYLAGATAVIAADGGTRHLLALDYVPDLVIGDLDSLSAARQKRLDTADTRFVTYPAAKNETDLELALLYAVAAYDNDILLFGALGGRFDQTLANTLLLAHPRLVGRQVQLVTRYQRAWLVTAQTEIHGTVGDTVSLIPLGGDVLVLATGGLRWPLQNEVLSLGPARGISNVMTADLATIAVESGRLLCLHIRQEWQR